MAEYELELSSVRMLNLCSVLSHVKCRCIPPVTGSSSVLRAFAHIFGLLWLWESSSINEAEICFCWASGNKSYFISVIYVGTSVIIFSPNNPWKAWREFPRVPPCLFFLVMHSHVFEMVPRGSGLLVTLLSSPSPLNLFLYKWALKWGSWWTEV